MTNLKHPLLKLMYMLIIFAVTAKPFNGRAESKLKRDINEVKNGLQSIPFDFHSPNHYYKEYLKFYAINNNNLKNLYGVVSIEEFLIFCQVFITEKSKGTVLLIHGYLDHSGSMKHLINLLTENDYNVALFDLPGHGLSSGERGSIKSFVQYVRVLMDVLNLFKEKVGGDIHLTGHSTGCSVIYDLISHPQWKTDFKGKIVFVAPLVRSYMYKISKSGFFISKFFRDGFKRNFSKGPSNDSEYCHFIENEDPLQVRYLPNLWLKALFSWNRRVKGFGQINKKALLLQGESDKVVDFIYNLKFLKKNMNLKTILYKKGRHHLLNEEAEIREKVLNEILLYLNGAKQKE